jgi:hypothetical protein
VYGLNAVNTLKYYKVWWAKSGKLRADCDKIVTFGRGFVGGNLPGCTTAAQTCSLRRCGT